MSDNQDNQQKNDAIQKSALSDSRKYSLLAVAALLLFSAYFFGKEIKINETYNNTATASNIKNGVNTPSVLQGEIIKADMSKRFSSDEILGDTSEAPKVTMIEYGSLTCPHCAHFHMNVLHAIKEGYVNSKKIQYIFRDYPLDGSALKATVLSRCDMTKRQAFLDLLYKKQAEWTKGQTIADIEKNLMVIGKMGGLSAEKITECLADKQMTQEILDVQKQSTVLYNIEATPSVLINDKKFTGDMRADDLKNILDSLLSQQPKAETATE